MEFVIQIQPVVFSHDKNGLTQRVHPQHTEEEWEKLIYEMRDCVEVYEQIYGIRVNDINKLDGNFISVSITVFDEEAYFKYGDYEDLDMVFSGFINHDLHYGGYPSFYRNNSKRNLKVDHFACL